MKYLTTIAFIFLLSSLPRLSAQPCLPDGITFNTQAQIDSFQINNPGCTQIEGDVEIGEYLWYSNITNLDSLSILTSIGGGLKIQYNALTDLSGLDNLTSIGSSVMIITNPVLTGLTGLENVTFIGGDIIIAENNALTNLTGLENMTSIENGLEIYQNNSLINIIGLLNVTYIGGYLIVVDNQSLINLSGLDYVNSISGFVIIRNNDNLTSLSGLDNLNAIGGYLEIGNNDALISLMGLNNLESIGDFLSIEGNNALPFLFGLDYVNSIGGFMTISYNTELTSLIGLDSINAGSITDLHIVENNSLTTCEVQSICDYLANPNGIIYIQYNDNGCNSQAEVEEACTVGLPESKTEPQLSTYPNPFTISTTIEYELTEPSHVQLTIYNAIGETIHTAMDCLMPQGKHSFTWIPQRLPEGMYYGVLRSEDGVSVVKIVKQ